MASAFSHIAVPAVLYAVFKSHTVNFKLFLVAAMCSVIPDADIIAFKFGIPIQVSPIGVSSFFTERGLSVIASELIWVLIPALVIGTIGAVLRRK